MPPNWTTLNVGVFHTIAATICRQMKQTNPCPTEELLRQLTQQGLPRAQIVEVLRHLTAPYDLYTYKSMSLSGEPLRLVAYDTDPEQWFRSCALLYQTFSRSRNRTLTPEAISRLLASKGSKYPECDWKEVLRELVRECGTDRGRALLGEHATHLVPRWQLTQDGFLQPLYR